MKYIFKVGNRSKNIPTKVQKHFGTEGNQVSLSICSISMLLDPDPLILSRTAKSMRIRIHNTVLNRIILTECESYLLIHLAVAGQEEGERLARPRLGDGDEVPVRHGHRPRLRLRSRLQSINQSQQSMNNRSIGPVLAMEMRSRSAMATGHVCARAAVHPPKLQSINQSHIQKSGIYNGYHIFNFYHIWIRTKNVTNPEG
jgi:hypothetical protein